MGVVSLLSERSARSQTSPGRVSERQVLPLLGLGRVLPKNAESLRNSDALMRVAVTRRRGPAELRDPIAVSLTAPMGFTVLVAHDNSTQGKILAGFTRWSAPCVLPRAAAPLLCPQHPSAADKTDRWKTGWAGSCRDCCRSTSCRWHPCRWCGPPRWTAALPICLRPSCVMMLVRSVRMSPRSSNSCTYFRTVLLLIPTALPMVA